MKGKTLNLFTVLLFAILIFQSCQEPKYQINEFTSNQDTLRVELSKEKGNEMFGFGFGSIELKDFTQEFPTDIIAPEDIDSLLRHPLKVDSQEKKNHTYVELVKGVKNGQSVFIVDQNNNKDLRDDPVREYKQIDWKNVESIPVTYTVSDGTKMVQDSSWIRIGDNYGNFLVSKYEYMKGDLTLDGKEFTLSVVDKWNLRAFNYLLHTEVIISSQLGVEKNSIAERDRINKGELVSLDGVFYRYHDVSNNGKVITLVKDQPIHEKTGTQVGMQAPIFSVITTEGEKLTNKQFQDKITLVANSCGCGGDKESTKAVSDIKDEFGDTIHVIQMDSAIKDKLNTYQVDSEVKENKEFYDNYRKQYCSRLVYVIGTNGIIIDKFSIFNWKEVLPSMIQ